MRRPLGLLLLTGAAWAAGLYAADLLLASGVSYMGVSDPGAVRHLLAAHLPRLLESEGRVLLLYLAAGMTAAAPAALWPPGGSRFAARLRPVFLPAVVLLSLLAVACCRRPFLFEDTLGRGLPGSWLLSLAASHGSPAAWLLPAGAVMLAWLGSSLRARSRWRAAAAACLLAAALAVPLAGLRFPGRFAPAVAGDRPPVILLGIDSLRPDMLEERHGGKPLLPNLDALRREAVLFPAAVVPQPHTFPSLVSLLTSLPPAAHGVRHMFPRLNGDRLPTVTLADVLGKAGWRTGVFADYGGDVFERVGLGFASVEAPAFNADTFMQSLLLSRHPMAMPLADVPGVKRLIPGFWVMRGYTDGPGVIRRGGDFLLAPGDPPAALLFLSTSHFPYGAPWPWYRLLTPPGYRGRNRYAMENPVFDPRGLSPPEVAQAGRLYRQGLRAADDDLGRLRRRLEAAGVWDRALVVVFSDHGEQVGEDGLGFGHGDHLFGERVPFVPLLLKLPGGERGGTLRPETVSIMDVAPTLLEALGVPAPPGWEGVSLLPAARGASPVTGRVLTLETALWFDAGISLPRGAGRMDYPGAAGLMESDEAGKVVIRREWEEAVEVAKHRGVVVDDVKLIYAPAGGEARFWLEEGLSPLHPRNVPAVDGSESPLVATLTDALVRQGLVRGDPYFVPAWRLAP